MGIETILLMMILAFAAGFMLDRLVIRQGRFDAAKLEALAHHAGKEAAHRMSSSSD